MITPGLDRGEDVATEADGEYAHARIMSTRSMIAIWCLIGCFVVVLAAGYILRLRWTGFEQDRQLWDLLHLIVLPAVLATLPLWYRTRSSWKRAWHIVFAATAVGFAVLITGGYAFGWTWTGFQGNTLWDWLELLALPVVVALLPLWVETHRRLEVQWLIALSVAAVTFAITIVGGYAFGWNWTGFEGNTLLQWVRMLFVPFILPASIAWYSTQANLNAKESESARPASPRGLPHPSPPAGGRFGNESRTGDYRTG